MGKELTFRMSKQIAEMSIKPLRTREEVKCTLCQGHYDFSFSDFYFIFVCCVEASK